MEALNSSSSPLSMDASNDDAVDGDGDDQTASQPLWNAIDNL